jgi:hypothetical protein
LQDGSEPTDFEQVINEVDELGEARYLISKLYAMTVNKSITAAQQQQEKVNAEYNFRQVKKSLYLILESITIFLIP